jgi:hypothetical protein
MDLIERYLQAVQFWLPKAQKDDIIAELSEDLHAQIEEREAVLNRSLTEPEVEAILKQRGRPVLVANRFLPQEQLIGPVLFPIYKFVLKIVMAAYLIPWALVWAGMMIFSPAYRAHELAHSWIAAVISAWSAWWGTAFFALSTVTLIFAILERVQARKHFLEQWDPRKLPAVRNPNVISRATATFELIVNLAGAVVWATNMYHPVALIPDIRISVSPLWLWFFWGFLLVCLANSALSAVAFTRPYWTTERAILRLLTDGVGSALFCWLMKANILIGFTIANVSPERTAEISNIINMWAVKLFPFAVTMGIWIACANGYRIVRLKMGHARPTFAAIAH